MKEYICCLTSCKAGLGIWCGFYQKNKSHLQDNFIGDIIAQTMYRFSQFLENCCLVDCLFKHLTIHFKERKGAC